MQSTIALHQHVCPVVLVRWFHHGMLAMLVVCCAPPHAGFARDNVIHARRLSVSDGLSSNYISCIVQDSKGYVWIGTREGLNRYDGHFFRQYVRRSNDSCGLQCDAITAIAEDSSGNVWIGTIDGLARLNRSTNVITTFRHDPLNDQSLHSNGVNALLVDAHGTLWIADDASGLNRFDAATESFHHYEIPADGDAPGPGPVNAIFEETRSGTLFVCCTVHTVLFSTVSDAFVTQEHPLGPSWRVCQDPANHDWVTIAGNGDANSTSFLFIHGNPVYNSPHEGCVIACADAWKTWGSLVFRSNGKYWLPVCEGGLQEIDLYRHTARPMIVTDGISNALSIDRAIIDRNGSVWFSTKDGVYVLDDRHDALRSDYVEDPRGSGDHQAVRALVFDRNRALWVGCGNGWMYRFDARTGGYARVGAFERGIHCMAINRIVEDQRGTLWSAATVGPYFTYPTSSGWRGTILRRFADKGDRNVYCMLKDSDGILWAGGTAAMNTDRSVLSRIDPNAMTIRQFSYAPYGNTAVTRAVWTLLERDRTSLWVGTAHGLFVFDKISGTFVRRYGHAPDDANSLSNDNTWVLRRTRDGMVWVGTWGGGLNCFDERTGTFRHVTVDDGLPSNYIRSMLEDSVGNLWVATSKGISCFNPAHSTFRNYTSADGLLDDEFEPNSCAVSPDGELFFGGTHGITHFFPAALREAPLLADPVLTALHVFGKERRGEIENGDTIRLRHDENYLTFDFSPMDFGADLTKDCDYMLEGFDRTWLDAGDKTSVAYNGVAPGTYVFRVRVAAAPGSALVRTLAVVVIVESPWWSNPQSRMGGLFSLIAVAGSVVVFRGRRRRLMERLLDDAREQERLGLAGELHDGPLQDLYAARFFLPAPVNVADGGDAARLDTLFRKSLTAIQAITGRLQMPHFESGLAQELRDICEGLHDRHPEMLVNVDGITNDRVPLRSEVEQHLYRIFRTALLNVEKHSGATVLVVEFSVRKHDLTLRIHDNGRGFHVASNSRTQAKNHHYGLLLMRSYAAAIGGILHVRSVINEGTEITVTARV